MAHFLILNVYPDGKEILIDIDHAVIRPSRLVPNKSGSFIMPDYGAGAAFEVWQSFTDIAIAVSARNIPLPHGTVFQKNAG